MTESLHLTAESKVLEIGTGSGYQAAVLSDITPHVFTIEIVEPLARRAIATFQKHGYDSIETRVGDGYAGWVEHAPYDGIIVTCAPDHIPPKLIEQLRTGGRICIPVGGEGVVQKLVVLTKRENGRLERESLIPVRFVPMTGEARTPKAGESGDSRNSCCSTNRYRIPLRRGLCNQSLILAENVFSEASSFWKIAFVVRRHTLTFRRKPSGPCR